MTDDYKDNVFSLPTRATLRWETCVEAVADTAGISFETAASNWSEILLHLKQLEGRYNDDMETH